MQNLALKGIKIGFFKQKQGRLYSIILKTRKRLTFCTVFYLVANFSKWLLFTFCWRLIKIVTATTKPWETYKRNCFSVFRCEKNKVSLAFFSWPCKKPTQLSKNFELYQFWHKRPFFDWPLLQFQREIQNDHQITLKIRLSLMES